jgi:transitional endoplasmic reticulum ATPase
MSKIPAAALVHVCMASFDSTWDELYVDQIKRLMCNLILRTGCSVNTRFGTIFVNLVVPEADQKSQDATVISSTTLVVINQPKEEAIEECTIDAWVEHGELQETLKEIIDYPNSIRKIGLETPKGILIYGPSGVGKTSSILRIAKQWNFELVSYPDSRSLSKDPKYEVLVQVTQKAR